MAYIYQIVNDVNGKIYVGKTEKTIQQRYAEHCKDAFKDSESHRPLYAAMRKYGLEHFSISLIEETENPEEREQFWIEQKQSYHFGYNATRGGDGKKYIDEKQVIEVYLQEKNATATAHKLNISQDSVIAILKRNQIKIVSAQEISRQTNSKPIMMLSLDDEILQEFESASDAARFLIDCKLTNCKLTTIRYHIIEVCNGRRKTAAKHKWKFKE